MRKVIPLIFFLMCLAVNAQSPKIHFEYDGAGNQIVRELCPFCASRTTNQPPKEISDLKEEDYQKFFPEDVISYYPNPVREELYLKWQLVDDVKVSAIEVYSISGQLVKSYKNMENEQTYSLPFQNYPTGVYSVNLFYNNGDRKSITIIKK